MHKELSIFRAIMRLYSFCDFDLQTRRIRVVDAHDILASYFKMEPAVKRALSEVGIEMYPTGVYSSFNGENKIVLEVFFIYSRYSIQIPEEILTHLSDTLVALGRNTTQPTPQTLQWAYSGRWMDKSCKHRFITDGLQMSDNRILIDFLTYSVASHDCLHHRLIHELLHTLGIEEDEMSCFILPACSATYDLCKPLIQVMLEQVQNIREAFKNSMIQLETYEPSLAKQLLKMGNELCLYGFPETMNTPIYTTTYMPEKLFPEPTISGYTVLLM